MLKIYYKPVMVCALYKAMLGYKILTRLKMIVTMKSLFQPKNNNTEVIKESFKLI